MPSIVLRLPSVKQRTRLSRSSIYLRISQGAFPKPVSLGGRAVGWLESEVDGWIASRIAESRGVVPGRRAGIYEAFGSLK